MLELGLIGAGIMGTNHARVSRRALDARVSVVVDPDETKGRALADHINADYASSVDALFGRVDAAIVTAPTGLHAGIGRQLMENGLDVLIEKPIASTVDDAKMLVACAAEYDRILMVGHVERFNPAVLELGQFVNDLLHIDIRRVGPFSPRVTADVMLDLMIHDIELVQSFAGAEVCEVAAIGRKVRTGMEDLAVAMLTFDTGISATLMASRVSQNKQRQIELTQRENVVVADLLRQQITLHRVEHAEYVGNAGARYRQNSVIEIPYLEQHGEPLALEQRHFVECVREHRQPLVSGAEGLAALELTVRIRDSVFEG